MESVASKKKGMCWSNSASTSVLHMAQEVCMYTCLSTYVRYLYTTLYGPILYLQYLVSRHQSVGTLGRAVILQTLYIYTIQVPSTELHPQLSLGLLQPHQPHLWGPARACTWR